MSYEDLKPDLSDILPEPLKGPYDQSFVHIQDVNVQYSLRVKREDMAKFKTASGWALSSKIGGSRVTRNYSVYCLGPDEWQLSVDLSKKDAVQRKMIGLGKKFIFSYADISHRNVTFKLTGPMAAQMINVGCPLDLSLDAFPINKCTRTVFENAEIMLLRTADDEFSVQTWRSFGPYLVGFFTKYSKDQA
jgi:sarcosine oxidase subunit gamma